MGESAHQLLEAIFCVCRDGCIVCKEHVSFGGFADLGLCSESCDVVHFPSDLVCMYTPSIEVPKACLRRREGRTSNKCWVFENCS